MTDLHAKTAILSWIRFKKRWLYVATEMEILPGYRADVMASDGESLYEFEVKTNIADVKRDFRNKVEKHIKYGDVEIVPTENGFRKASIVGEVKEKWKDNWEWFTHWEGSNSRLTYSSWNSKYATREEALEALRRNMESKVGVPNKLIYVVHESIAEESKAIIPSEYGIVSFKDHLYSNVSTVRKAKELHSGAVTKPALAAFLSRMSSEIANLHIGMCHANFVKDFHREALDACNRQDATGIDEAMSGE
jgi:hypothetical protein